MLDHGKRPRNAREIPGARRVAADNPVCGDRATVFVLLDGDRLRDLSFVAAGCSILIAAASMMTERLRGVTRGEAESLAGQFEALVQPPAGVTPAGAAAALGPLSVFAAVRAFPGRHQCAVLPWRTLRDALGRPDAADARDQAPPAAAPRPAT